MALSPASVSGPCRSPPPTAGSGASAPTCFLRPRSGVAARFSRRFSKRNEEVHITSPGAALLETVQASNSLSYSVSYFCHTPVIQIVIQVVILLFASWYAKRKLLSHVLSYPNLNVICNARIRPQPIPRHVQPRSAAGMSRFQPSRTVLRNQSQLINERHTGRWRIGLVAEENSSVVYQLPISRCMIKLSHCLSLRCCF